MNKRNGDGCIFAILLGLLDSQLEVMVSQVSRAGTQTQATLSVEVGRFSFRGSETVVDWWWNGTLARLETLPESVQMTKRATLSCIIIFFP
jgi:hypothetical protein